MPWDLNSVKGILSKVLLEYQQVMNQFCKGTGGGPGKDSSYVIWHQGKNHNIVGYVMGKLYLTIIHIWEKALNFPLMLEKPLIHDEFAIDDDYVDSNNKGSVPASAEITPSKQKSKDDDMNASVASALRASGNQRMESTALLSNAIGKFAEAISTAESGSNNADNTTKWQEILKAIMDTTNAKDSYTTKLSALKTKRSTINAQSDMDANKKERKLTEIDREVAQYKGLLTAFGSTLNVHKETLNKINKSEGVGVGGNGDDISSSDNE